MESSPRLRARERRRRRRRRRRRVTRRRPHALLRRSSNPLGSRPRRRRRRGRAHHVENLRDAQIRGLQDVFQERGVVAQQRAGVDYPLRRRGRVPLVLLLYLSLQVPHRRGRGGEFGREVHDRRVERALHRDANRDRGRVPGAARRGRRSRGGHYREVARERGRPRTSIAPSAAPRRARCDGICDVTLANKKAVTRQRQISTAADEAAVHTRVARRTRRCARCARSRALARGASTSAARSSRRPARPRRPRRRSTPRHRLGRRRRGDGRRRRRHRGGCPRASPASAPR